MPAIKQREPQLGFHVHAAPDADPGRCMRVTSPWRFTTSRHRFAISKKMRHCSWPGFKLGNSALEINEAAYLLGFEDPNSFGRAFRAWEGMPPRDWRETHQTSKVM